MPQKKTWLATRAESLLATTLINSLRYFPKPVANGTANAAVRLLDRLVPKLRRVAHTNLLFAYPQLSERQREEVISGVFRSVARLLLSIARFPDINLSNVSGWIGYEGLEHYLEAKAAGKGVLVATAHLGNWELSAFSHALMTEPMNVMVRPLDNASIDRLVESRRTLSGNTLIYKREGARAVLRALRKNEAVGILIDQNTAVTEGVFVEFFSKLACANTGFVKLAYRSSAPIIPGFALWDEKTGRYILRFYPPIPLSGDEQRDTQAVQSAIEAVIRQYPDQWMWIHRRWKTRPPGEEPIY